jgi:hypothetical protein
MRTVLLIIALFRLTAANAQQPVAANAGTAAYRAVPFTLNMETNCKGGKAIRRVNKQAVSFAFFQDRSDSVSIYVNGQLVFSRYIVRDSNLVSTDFTGITWARQFPDKTNTVRIAWHRHQCYLEFQLNKKFPLYAIYFLQDDKFYVSGRKCVMVIK